jgi:hypothetical protein
MKNTLVLLAALGLGFAATAFADSPSAPGDLPLALRNGVARETALRRIEQTDKVEGAYYRAQVSKLRKLGVVPGPFCVQLKNGCLTRRDIGYREGEYYSLGELKNLPKLGIYTSMYSGRLPTAEAHERFQKIAEENGVSGLSLMYAIEYQEKLGLAYLEQYAIENPNRPNHTWEIGEDGKVFEKEHSYCDDCH